MTKVPNEKFGASNDVDRNLRLLADSGLMPFASLMSVWTNAITALSEDTLKFMTDRLRQDMYFQQAMMNCKTLQEMRELQTSFIEKAYAQYGEATAKMMSKGTAAFDFPHEKHHATPV